MKKLLNRRLALAILGMTSALAASGCASLPPSFRLPPSYKQPTLPAEELATIGIDPNSKTLSLSAVDGAYFMLGGVVLSGSREDQKIIPGERAVTVFFDKTDGVFRAGKSITLIFEARAGERYTIHEESKLQAGSYEIVSWITDTSGATVPLTRNE